MEKLSATEAKEVLAEVEPMLMGLITENRGLREKVAQYERRDHAERIVDNMADRGHTVDHREKVAELLSDPDRDLNVVEEAVRLDSPVIKLASVGEEDEPGSGADPLTEAILG